MGGSLSGGSVRILWDADDSAEVTITGGVSSWTVNGSAVTFPYTLSSSTTFETAHSGTYTVSVQHHGHEVANTPDGTREVELRFGEQAVFEPTVDDTGGGQWMADLHRELSATYATRKARDPREFGAVGDGIADDTAAIQSALDAGDVELPPLTFKVASTLTVPDGRELRGTGPKTSVLQAAGDYVVVKTVGGEGQSLKNFKIANSFTGTRTTHDVEIINPFHPVLENLEIALSQSSLQKGGIYIHKDVGQVGSDKCFMPVLSNTLIRNGVLKIENVTDVKVFGGWTWATYTAAPGGVELAGASNCSFVNHDIVPSVNAGYLVSAPLSNLSIEGGLMDGNGDPAIHTGTGFKVADTAYIRKLTIHGVKFWNLWLGAIDLYDVRNAVISGNVFSQNNRSDNFVPEINVTACQANVISGNAFSAPDDRVNKGKIYVEDAASTDNIVDLNTMEYNNGTHYYALPLATLQNGSYLGRNNRPDVAWPWTGVLTKGANYTVTKEDLFAQRDIFATGTITLTLPSAASVHAGNELRVKNTGTGQITIASVSAQTIDGLATTVVLSPGQAIAIQSDGAGWQSVGLRAPGAAIVGSALATLATVSASAWPAANTAVFQRFTVHAGRSYRYINLRLDGSSGNYQVGIVRLTGSDFTNYTRVMDSGVVATPVAGDLHVDLGATHLPAGEYALFVWFDNTIATTRYASNSGISSMQLSAEVSALTTGVPASGTVAWNSTKFIGGANLASA